MENRDDYKYLEIKDAITSINQKVSLFGSIIEFGLPQKTRGTDWICTVKIMDESYQNYGLSVNIFTSTPELLPRILSLGDIIQLSNVMMKSHNGEVNAVFNKSYSWFALYEGKEDCDFHPYQHSSKYHPRDQDFKFILALRKWLVNLQLHEGPNSFMFLREIKERERASLACKVLHVREVADQEWIVYLWDGTDSPPISIHSKLEHERDNPLQLHVEPLPLPRDVLCTFPTVGSVFRLIIDKGMEKYVLHLLRTGQWIKFVSVFCEVDSGLWHGMLTPLTKLRYISNESQIISACQKSFNDRLSSESGRMPYWCFPWFSDLTEVNYADAPFMTLMDVLTSSEVTAKFKCIVRVVAAFPWHAKDFYSPLETYAIRLTIEDPTARIHAFLYAEDGEKFFDGYPPIDVLMKKRNALLGVGVDDRGEEIDAPRNPPWVQCCLKSYYLNRNDPWGSRQYRIFGTKINPNCSI